MKPIQLFDMGQRKLYMMKKMTTMRNIAIAVAISGLIIILIGFTQKNQGISNFQDRGSSITVIDLSKQKTNRFNYYLIVGLTLVGVGFSILLIKPKEIASETAGDLLEKLTLQEQKIARLMIDNNTNKEIANSLFISVSTVKTHTNNIYKKLSVNSRTELVKLLKSGV